MAAKKTTPAKKEEGEKKTRAPRIANETKIEVLVKENPKREGSNAHERFKLYGKCKTVGAYKEAGGQMGDIHYDVAHEFIKLIPVAA
jgi:hypothetical protein